MWKLMNLFSCDIRSRIVFLELILLTHFLTHFICGKNSTNNTYDANKFPTAIAQESSFLLTLSTFVLYKSSLAVYTVKLVLQGHLWLKKSGLIR